MKNKFILPIVIIGLFSITTFNLQAQHCGGGGGHGNHSKSTNQVKHTSNKFLFQVDGSCTMCKKRIETAAQMVSGVLDAKWDLKTHLITIEYEGKISDSDVKRAIANIGHDTDGIKSTDLVYNALPGCCKYVRKK